mmetsp:Transcript_69354/g.206541  ORF Transcript_69354/g.206541 Transcript_69354/m.206541 type:complete len:209 (-) Transcript_69354:27-653(-)
MRWRWRPQPGLPQGLQAQCPVPVFHGGPHTSRRRAHLQHRRQWAFGLLKDVNWQVQFCTRALRRARLLGGRLVLGAWLESSSRGFSEGILRGQVAEAGVAGLRVHKGVHQGDCLEARRVGHHARPVRRQRLKGGVQLVGNERVHTLGDEGVEALLLCGSLLHHARIVGGKDFCGQFGVGVPAAPLDGLLHAARLQVQRVPHGCCRHPP